MQIPDLIIESVIRDGIENIKAKPEMLDDIFGVLTSNYAERKYGASEITKIKEILTGTNKDTISVVHSMHDATSRVPCYSIQLGDDTENKQYLEDHEEEICVPLDATELASLVKIPSIQPLTYTASSGKLTCDDTPDLSLLATNYIFEDASGVEHQIQSGISNVDGNKFFYITKNATVDLTGPGLVKSFLTEKVQTIKSVHMQVTMVIGVHAESALMTKYLYVLLKNILLSRKADLISRCFDNMVISGSDFTRDTSYQGDRVFTRFLTIKGLVADSWNADQMDLIDQINVDVTATE